MKLSVHLLTYNGAKYVPYLFQSLRKQTLLDWELLIIDNASTDDTVERVRAELHNFPVASRVIVNDENIGFARGHNQAFLETSSEYFLVLNQDIYLDADCLHKIVHFLDTHQGASALTVRLMRWNFDNIAHGLDKTFTNQIDSLGLELHPSRRVTELGVGREWAQPPHQFDAVFGASGAALALRRSSATAILLPSGALFDPDYHSYKEDVDLCLRLRSHGGAVYVLYDAVGYHDRSAAGLADPSDWAAAKNKTTQTKYVSYHSYKNHLMTLYKNEYWQNTLLDFFPILWYETKKFVWFLLFSRSVLAGIAEIWKLRRNLKAKRRSIIALRTVPYTEIRKWIV